MLVDPLPAPKLILGHYDDVFVVDGEEVLDAIGDCYRDGGAMGHGCHNPFKPARDGLQSRHPHSDS